MATKISPQKLSWLVALLCAIFPPTIAQQGAPNVTLVFSQNTTEKCASDDESLALTFSTGFFDPSVGFCLNLEDVFTGNGTERQASVILSFATPVEEFINVSFAVSGRENWDPTANYSTVLYTQLDVHDSHKLDDSNYYAQRDVSFHANPYCNYGFTSNCRTAGDCEELPIAIRSFGIYRPDPKDPRGGRQRSGHCKLAAKYDAAGATVRPELLGLTLMALALALLQFFT